MRGNVFSVARQTEDLSPAGMVPVPGYRGPMPECFEQLGIGTRRPEALFREQGFDVVEHRLRVKEERAVDLAEIEASNGKTGKRR